MKKIIKKLMVLLAAVLICIPQLNVSAVSGYSDVNMFEAQYGIKGMQGAKDENLYGGLEHTLVNIFLDDAIKTPDSLWAKNGWIAPYEFEGEKFYFNGDPAGLGFVPLANSKGMSISVVFLLRNRTDEYGSNSSFLIDPDSRVEGYAYYAPNANLNTYGGRAIRAYWHFLMELLIDEGYHIDNFILGNEVNMPNQWHYSGSRDGSGDAYTAATKYADAFYYMYSAVRQYTDVSRCSVCVDHSWNNDNEGRGIAARQFLHLFNNRLEQHERGVEWCVSTHLYPAQLFDTEIWKDPHNLAPNSSDARIIDGSNLSVMTNYIRETFGSEHRVMLTEQGFSDECGEAAQAACLAYTYYAAMYDPMVDCFLINVSNDGKAASGESLNFNISGTLAEKVYTKIGNGNEADQQWIADVCLPVIGIQSWNEVIPNYGQNVDKTNGKTDYSAVFDAEYYYTNNADVANAFGYNEKQLLNHFVSCGMSEGRVASAEFNINYYKSNYGDLAAGYGDDNEKYYMHYINWGKAEGRIANRSINEQTAPAIDYSPVFNADYYYNANADIASVFGHDYNQLLNHFVNYGMSEGRVASSEFDINVYKSNNEDLVNVYGNDNEKYYIHYINWGKAEGRVANGSTGGEIIPEFDYSSVFDADYYYNLNGDVAAIFGHDEEQLLKHFINYGMAEGRAASAEFDVDIYKSNYEDLVTAFGDENEKYYMHYINYGKSEGRIANMNTNEQLPTTPDYSLVFDADYYYNANSDVADAFGYDEEQLLNHFISAGMSEGRIASESFNVYIYRQNNGDLQEIYGDDWTEYYMHYIQYGYAENRVCK